MTSTTIRSTNIGLVDRIVRVLGKLYEERQRYALYRRTLTELEGLSERELADLGLHGSMINNVAREAAYGK